ncbi:hypothetical protein JCM5353_004871 [Sporobolomyces roseus]
MDSPQLSSFIHAASFAQESSRLCSLDYTLSPTPTEEVEEQQILIKLCNQLDEYQEQSYLLDPSLEGMVNPLIQKLREQILLSPEQALRGKRVQRIARLLYFITKVRGAKVVLRFFPHEVTDLIHLLSILSTSNDSSSLAETTWELRYLLLLWLSVCVRLPFDLARLEEGTGERIEGVAERWIGVGSKEREGGIEVLGRYYSRQDAPLDKLIRKCEEALQKDDNLLFSSGLVQTLCIVLKTSSGSQLVSSHWSSLYRLLAFLPQDGTGGAVLGKYRVKLAGRLALMRLGKELEKEEDVPEEVEVILGELIEGLSHPDTIVRWSAAKYLARLTSPLPSEFASTVIESVLSLFEECLEESDRAEHGLQGACFAFGELGRRGLIRDEEEVKRLLEGVMKALLFDRRRNMQTIGSSVRDSAAYVLWSLARTLTPDQARPYAQQLAERLVCVAVFDREVSIRRAASAAFQEAVGRWGVFPHGIDVLRKIDFFTVSVRHRAYLSAAPSVALHSEYRQSIIDHLLSTGITHYDSDIRELSAQALGTVTGIDAESLAEDLIKQQLEKLATKDSAKLHGTLLSLAALAESIEGLEETKREELRSQVFSSTIRLLDTPPSARLLKTSHLVLFAALLSLTNSAPSRSSANPLSNESRWIEILHHAGDQSDEKVHAQAGEAIRRISESTNCSRRLTLITDLESRSGTRQQAAVLMLGKVNYSSLNQTKVVDVVERLTLFVSKEGSRKAATVEARRNGVEALASILLAQTSVEPLTITRYSLAFDALLPGLNDYTSDQRGDVGSWVRATTLRSLTKLLPALIDGSSPFSETLSQVKLDTLIGTFAKLAVERIDSVRLAAGEGLVEIAQVEEREGQFSMKGKALLVDTISEEDTAKWRDLAWASEQVLPLLEIPEYRPNLLEGALLATNQHSSSTPFLDYLLMLPILSDDSTSYSLLQALQDLQLLAKRNFSSNRIFVPFLFILSSLAEAGVLEELSLEESGEGEKCVKSGLAIAVNSIAKTKAAPRVAASSKVVTSFLAIPAVSNLAAEKLPLFLLHHLTWLRQQTADDLFGVVSTLDLGDESAELESLLTETSWSSNDCETEAARVVELLKPNLQ